MDLPSACCSPASGDHLLPSSFTCVRDDLIVPAAISRRAPSSNTGNGRTAPVGGLLRNKATRAVIVFIGNARPIVTAQRGVRSRSCVGEEPNWYEKLLYISALVRFARVSSGTNTPVKGLNSDLRLMERRICTQIKEQDK
jgi:hypothetical protein